MFDYCAEGPKFDLIPGKTLRTIEVEKCAIDYPTYNVGVLLLDFKALDNKKDFNVSISERIAAFDLIKAQFGAGW